MALVEARKEGRLADTVWATGISVTLTVISVAHSVAEACAFRPEARCLASICSAEALHVVGRKIHVLRTVCNYFTRVPTTLPPRRTFTGQQ